MSYKQIELVGVCQPNCLVVGYSSALEIVLPIDLIIWTVHLFADDKLLTHSALFLFCDRSVL